MSEVKPLYHDTCHHKIYGLSCAEFDALHAYAGGCCQICHLPERDAPRGRLCIDHLGDYGLHLVRGLLCDKCNRLMQDVDRRRVRLIGTRVYEYRHNSWFARKLDPKGEHVRYRSQEDWHRRLFDPVTGERLERPSA